MTEEINIKLERNPPPIPKTKNKYPWRQMKIGDSFVIDKPLSYVSCLVQQTGNRLGMKFACRTLPGKGIKIFGGVRVWRIE